MCTSQKTMQLYKHWWILVHELYGCLDLASRCTGTLWLQQHAADTHRWFANHSSTSSEIVQTPLLIFHREVLQLYDLWSHTTNKRVVLKFLRGIKVKADIALPGGIPTSELRDVTCHMGSHSVTCHLTQVNAPCLTPAMQAGTRFTYRGGMEGWVDLVDLIAPRPGVEAVTFRSRVRRRTTAPPGSYVISLLYIHVSIGNMSTKLTFQFLMHTVNYCKTFSAFITKGCKIISYY